MQQDIPSFMHPASGATLSAYCYTTVYASADATPTINGTLVSLGAGTSLNILVRSISATPNVFVLGDKISVFKADPNLSSHNPNS